MYFPYLSSLVGERLLCTLAGCADAGVSGKAAQRGEESKTSFNDQLVNERSQKKTPAAAIPTTQNEMNDRRLFLGRLFHKLVVQARLLILSPRCEALPSPPPSTQPASVHRNVRQQNSKNRKKASVNRHMYNIYAFITHTINMMLSHLFRRRQSMGLRPLH